MARIELTPGVVDEDGCWITNPILWQDFVRARIGTRGKPPNKAQLFTEDFCAQYIDLEYEKPIGEDHERA